MWPTEVGGVKSGAIAARASLRSHEVSRPVRSSPDRGGGPPAQRKEWSGTGGDFFFATAGAAESAPPPAFSWSPPRWGGELYASGVTVTATFRHSAASPALRPREAFT